jgi:hypothetical protein
MVPPRPENNLEALMPFSPIAHQRWVKGEQMRLELPKSINRVTGNAGSTPMFAGKSRIRN